MSTHAEMSKRGELHSKLCDLVEEHGMQEVLWMFGQLLEDRDEVLTLDEVDHVIRGEYLKQGRVTT